MLQALFFDRLMIGDSYLINLSYLRSLFWPEQTNGSLKEADLSVLLDHGVIVPAMRSSASTLHDVWTDIADRNLPYVGDEEYVRFIESHISDDHVITYDTADVSALFRNQVLATLSPDNPHLRLKSSIRRAALDFVLGQDTLYHVTMRQWMEREVDRGRMTSHHKEVLERVLAASYLYNVPKAIHGSLIDVPLAPERLPMPIDMFLGRREIFPGTTSGREVTTLSIRPFCLNPRVLGEMSAETLIAIRRDPTRRSVMRRLDDFRRTGQADTAALAGDVEAFLYRAEEIAYADVRGELRDVMQEMRRSKRRTRLSIARDVGLAVAGLTFWGTLGNVEEQIGNASGYLGLVVTAWASVDALRRFGNEYRQGYAVGRAIPDEHRLLLDRISAVH